MGDSLLHIQALQKLIYFKPFVIIEKLMIQLSGISAVDALRYSILTITTDGLFIDEKVAVKAIQPEHVTPIPMEFFEISGNFTRMDEDFLFHGQVHGVFDHPCDRCLEAAHSTIDVEVYWHFEEGPEWNPYETATEEVTDDIELSAQAMEAPGVCTYQHGIIDLAPYLWEELCFAMPMKFLCSEHCKGLCPQCGINLNQANCQCAQTQQQSDYQTPAAFAKLADMFPDLPKDNSDN